jgi:sigma-E factor negative regulatory protein RseA
VVIVERISALVDGEVEGDVDVVIDRVIKDQEARSCWSTYHLISDAFRNEYLLSRDFVSEVGLRLAQEPTILAPRARRNVISRMRTHALSAAASVAAVAIVGWLAFGTNPLTSDPAAVTIASLPQQASSGGSAVGPTLQPVALDGNVRAYLFAHQEYSPATQMQGVAPYVRTVSEAPNNGSR